jgi:predicted outer membrane repeat protein
VASSSVENNTANQSGGAIAAGGDVSVSASTVSGNSADNGNGGAISTTGAVSVLVSTLSENEANGNGGAIASNSNVTVDETDLISNYANGQGGAIFAEETVVVIASTVERNASGFAGGAIAATDVEVRNGSVISGNSSLGNGGAIHASGTVLISESTLGTAEISNPDYNPIQWIADPVLTNPLASNPFYNVDVPQFLPNPYYSPEITECGRLGLPVVNLPGMGGATGCIISEVENGYSYQLSTTPNPYYNPNLTIPNWQYDDQQFIPNPNYDPNAVIENPDYNPTEFIEIGNTTAMSGGSIFADGEVNIIDSILNGAEAEENGGAVKTNHSVHISGSHIYSNRAYGFGGAIDVADGSTEESTFIDSEIRSNIASSAGAFDGNEGPLTIQNTEFVSNVAITEGGAIWHMGSITIEQGSLFQSNFSVGPLIQTIDSTFSAPEQEDEIWWKNFSAGGAIRINTDELSEEQKENIVMIIRDSEFEYNLALGHGGAISFQGLLYVLRSRFEYNTSFIGDGGAINGTEISIESSVFNNNRALLPENLVNGCYELEGQLQFLCNGYGQGGAIHGTEIEISSDPNSVRSSFQGNISMDDGGAIHVNGHIQVSDTDFILNRTLIGDGGAIDIDSLYDPSIDEYVNFISFFDSTLFSENLSDGDGGAIDGNQGAIVISDSAFEGNQAYDDGGAIWNDGHVSVVDSEFLGNIAEDNGGAIYADTVEIARSRFNSNESENGSGGAVFIHTSSDEPELSVIISSVFEENFASYFGGAVSGSTWIITSSFTNNSAGINGSAIALEGSLGTQLIGSSLIGDDLVDLCSIPFFNSPSSYATDSSCFPLFFEEITGTGASYVLTEDELLEEQYSFSASYFLTENNGYFEMLNNSEAISNLVDYLTGVYEELEQSNDYIEYQGALDELEAELFSIEMRGWELSQIINCWLNEDCDKSELIPLNDALSENISLNDRIEEVTWEITLLNHTVSSLETDSLLLSATNKLFDNSFIEENIGFDVNMTARPSVVNWNVGAVQFLADSSPEDNNFDNNGDNTNGGNDQTDNDPIVVPPSNIDYVIDEDAILKARAQAAELARIEKERYEAELRAAAELAAKKREIRDALKAKRKAELEKRKLATQLLRDKIASRKRNVESDAKTDLPQYLSKRFVNLHSSRPF